MLNTYRPGWIVIRPIFIVLLFILIPVCSAEDIQIVDIYSDIDSADISIHSDGSYADIGIDADLIFSGKVLRSRHLTIESVSPNTDITKVLYWDIKNPSEGFYRTRITLSTSSSIIETRYSNFSYGWQALPRIFIKDIIPDSSGISIILSPPSSQLGTSPVLTDVECMLVDGDTVIYRTTDRRVTVVQATPISKDWNVVLENNHEYSTRIKARMYSFQGATIAQSRDFTAIDDARITEVFRDGTGASVTVVGQSQVPFDGSIVFTITKDGDTVEEISERSPILMSGDDETIEVIWSRRLQPGVYRLSIKVVGNDGDVVDRWDTIIEAEQGSFANEDVTPTPTQTPGFAVSMAAISFMVIILSGWVNRRNG